MVDEGPSRAIVVRDLKVLVTAGAGAIGLAIAGEGAKVHILDGDAAALASAISPTADLNVAADADRAVADLQSQLGGFDALVNNIGIVSSTALAEGVGVERGRQADLAQVSLRRTAEAEDAANLDLFLTSDFARNITGQAISVDGHVEFL